MKEMIPRYLFRGDDDNLNIRHLRETIDYFQLETNLINGGNGRKIKEEPLLKLINEHVGFGWPQTHFLSFSECETTACRFGLHCEFKDVENKMFEFLAYDEQDKNWNFAIITIDTERIEWKKIDHGTYEGLFPPSLLKFRSLKNYRIICINVIEALGGQEQYLQSITNAKRDAEWLILPATLFDLNSTLIEYSAILDGACISEIKKYKQS